MTTEKHQKIKINFTDFWADFDISTSFFYKLLSTKYDLEISDDPDLLFYSAYGRTHQKYNCTKVFYTGENMRPNFAACDFAFSFDYPVTKKNYRLPLYALYDDVNKLVCRDKDWVAELNKKTKFCCFIVSNASCETRNDFFLELSKCKRVDSAGTLHNNIGGSIENKREFIRQYKFVIAFENSSSPGYVTEKIFEPLLEDCVPIYWGSPLVHKDFNTNRFINCHDFENFNAVINHVLAVDADDSKYLDYLNQPVFENDILPTFLDNGNILAQLNIIVAYSKERSIKKKIIQTIRPLTFLGIRIFHKLKIAVK